jgi:phosphatidylinositol alpha-1,6-mannosyltransferase
MSRRGLRTLALCTDSPAAPGGIARYVRGIVRGLCASDHVSELELLARRGAAQDDATAAARVRVYPRRAAFVAAALAAAHRRPDLVLCGHLHYASLAWLVARIAGAPMWSFAYGIEAWARPPRVRRAAFERSDRIIAISRYTRRAVLDWARVEPWRCCIVHPTVTLPATVPARGPGAQARDPVLLSVGRLDSREAYKGHDVVIAALKNLARGHPGIRYLVAGDGDDLPRLQALAQREGVAPRVRFLGHVHADTLAALYREADVFVMPSSGEGFGIVFIEALAAGLPVVAARAGGSVDPLRDGELGEMVPPGDPVALADAVARLLTGPPAAVPAAALRGFGDAAHAARLDLLLQDLDHRRQGLTA